MFYKHVELTKFDKLLGLTVVENDMVKYIVLPKPFVLLNSMLERNKK